MEFSQPPNTAPDLGQLHIYEINLQVDIQIITRGKTIIWLATCTAYLHILSNMETIDVLAVDISIQLLIILLEASKPLIAVRNI